MYSAQLTGLEADKAEFPGEERGANYVASMANEIAVSLHGWGPNDVLADEGVVELAQILAARKIRNIRCLRNSSTAVLKRGGFTYEPAVEAQPKGDNSVEVDIPAEIRAHPILRNLGLRLLPTQDMANSFSKEVPSAQNASPRADLTWRVDKASHSRARGDERSRHVRYAQAAACLDSAQSALYRLRIIFAGELAGARAKFGGFRVRLRLSP